MRNSLLFTLLLVAYSLSIQLCVFGGPNPTIESLTVEPCNQRHDSIAIGDYEDHIDQTGWSELHISTKPAYDDHLQAYAAGLLEGQLTVTRTYQYIVNNLGGQTGYSPKLATFVKDNIAWMQAQIVANPSDSYWHQVSLLFAQFDGLYKGFNDKSQRHQLMPKDVVYAVQLAGDLHDLCPAKGCVGKRQETINSTANSHCSVLIKLLPGFKDIISGHTTWATFESMTRVYKSYDFGYHRAKGSTEQVPGKKIFFSSYPGTLSSVDDFYQIDSGLMVTETTLENQNASLWDNIKTDQVPTWIRTMLANRLATNGAEWMQIYQKLNSGTYNNQWIVVDYNKFTPEKSIDSGILWVGEQMPGYFIAQDMSQWLYEKGNWVSYNRPFYPFIFNISGQPAMVEKYGAHFSWNDTARAVIFRNKQHEVVNEQTYRTLIRWNDFEHDDVGTQGCTDGVRSGSNAISERGDLTRAGVCIHDLSQQDEAGTDAKYTNYKMMRGDKQRMTVVAQSGPTHDIQPPFVWSKSHFSHIDHIGLPDLFAFPWITLHSE